VARVNAAALWSLAQAPGTPKRPIIVTTQLTNDTVLRWQRGTEPDLAGYEVVWRETTAPEWQRVIPIGDVTEITIDLSMDNVFSACGRSTATGAAAQSRSPTRQLTPLPRICRWEAGGPGLP
jgi:hypothetical protein